MTLAQVSPPLPEIKDIAPPVDVFPYPAWMVALAVALALLVLGCAVFLVIRWWRSRPPPLPPSPRAAALRELERLRTQVETMEPYAFSIAVSDVLRTFVGGEYGLHAREQTSPEFLAAVRSAPSFSTDDRTLLERFLERVDMIKFARVAATTDDSRELLASAVTFVRGGRG